MFRIGASYKLKEMRKRIGNFQLQQVFPQVGKEIVCALLDKKHNPKAPDEVLVGIGPRMSEKAKRLAREGTGFRVFIKRSSDLWKYGGQYHVSRILEEGDPEGRRVWMQRGREDEPGIVR